MPGPLPRSGFCGCGVGAASLGEQGGDARRRPGVAVHATGRVRELMWLSVATRWLLGSENWASHGETEQTMAAPLKCRGGGNVAAKSVGLATRWSIAGTLLMELPLGADTTDYYRHTPAQGGAGKTGMRNVACSLLLAAALVYGQNGAVSFSLQLHKGQDFRKRSGFGRYGIQDKIFVCFQVQRATMENARLMPAWARLQPAFPQATYVEDTFVDPVDRLDGSGPAVIAVPHSGHFWPGAYEAAATRTGF